MKYVPVRFNNTPKKTWLFLLVLLIIASIQLSFFADQVFTNEGVAEGTSEQPPIEPPVEPPVEPPIEPPVEPPVDPENPEPEPESPQEPEDEKDEEEGDEPDAELLADWDYDASVYYVVDFEELERAITKSKQANITVILEDNIYMENAIRVTDKESVLIDGQNQFVIDENEAKQYNFRIAANTTFTLRNVTIYGHTNYAIVNGRGTYVHAIFDNITYIGPQLVYIEQSYGRATVIGGQIYVREHGAMTYDSRRAEEVFQVPEIYLYGNVYIEHLYSRVNTIMDAAFYTAGDSPHTLVVGDYANVTVKSGSFFFYSGKLNASVTIGRYATLDVTACGGMGNNGHGDSTPIQKFNSFVIEEGGTFAYTQRESTAGITGIHEQDYARSIPIRGTFRMEKDSAFLYDSEYTGRWYGGNGGLYLQNTSVILNSPKIFSVYNPAGAMHTHGDTGTVSDWGSTSWTVNGVNAVNSWTDWGSAAPIYDQASNLPGLVWNSYTTDAETYSSSIGESFNLNIPSTGIISAPDILDVLTQTYGVSGQNIRTNTLKRFVLGNISAFTVDKITVIDGGITGSLSGQDAAASYSNGEAGDTRTAGVTGGRYDMRYGEILPAGGSKVAVAGNNMGLRAVILTEAYGDLRILSVPDLEYGTHELPTSTTTYYRNDNETVTEGAMSVFVEDTRGPDATNWTLSLRRAENEDLAEGQQPIPQEALVFRGGEEIQDFTIGTEANPVYFHTQGPVFERIETNVKWDRESGILAEFRPGQIKAGVYRARVIWSLEVTP